MEFEGGDVSDMITSPSRSVDVLIGLSWGMVLTWMVGSLLLIDCRNQVGKLRYCGVREYGIMTGHYRPSSIDHCSIFLWYANMFWERSTGSSNWSWKNTEHYFLPNCVGNTSWPDKVLDNYGLYVWRRVKQITIVPLHLTYLWQQIVSISKLCDREQVEAGTVCRRGRRKQSLFWTLGPFASKLVEYRATFLIMENLIEL